jgi:hypothetical protein
MASSSTCSTSGLRTALHPLAADLDAEVLEFLLGLLTEGGAPPSSADAAGEVIASFVPGYSELPAQQRYVVAARVVKAVGGTGPAAAVAAGNSSSKAPRPGGAGAGSGGPVDDTDSSSSSSSSSSDAVWERAPSSELELLLAKARPELVAGLRGLFPHLSEEALRFALGRAGGDLPGAAEWALEHDAESEYRAEAERDEARAATAAARRASEAAAEARARRETLKKFDEREDDTGKLHRPGLPPEMLQTHKKGDRVMKYLDGRPVYVRPGEKFFEEPVQQFGTAHSLKIKKKGQGGASPKFA